MYDRKFADVRTPTFHGGAGTAWRLDGTTHRPNWPASLDLYLVHCPAAHPLWSWYVVSGCSLADLPGVPPARKHYPEAEWEVSIFALNPEHDGDLMVWLRGPASATLAWRHLEPVNVVEQFHGVDRDGANRILGFMARAIVNGTISPDSDAREAWKGTIANTVEHMTTGGHPNWPEA